MFNYFFGGIAKPRCAGEGNSTLKWIEVCRRHAGRDRACRNTLAESVCAFSTIPEGCQLLAPAGAVQPRLRYTTGWS